MRAGSLYIDPRWGASVRGRLYLSDGQQATSDPETPLLDYWATGTPEFPGRVSPVGGPYSPDGDDLSPLDYSVLGDLDDPEVGGKFVISYRGMAAKAGPDYTEGGSGLTYGLGHLEASASRADRGVPFTRQATDSVAGIVIVGPGELLSTVNFTSGTVSQNAGVLNMVAPADHIHPVVGLPNMGCLPTSGLGSPLSDVSDPEPGGGISVKRVSTVVVSDAVSRGVSDKYSCLTHAHNVELGHIMDAINHGAPLTENAVQSGAGGIATIAQVVSAINSHAAIDEAHHPEHFNTTMRSRCADNPSATGIRPSGQNPYITEDRCLWVAERAIIRTGAASALSYGPGPQYFGSSGTRSPAFTIPLRGTPSKSWTGIPSLPSNSYQWPNSIDLRLVAAVEPGQETKHGRPGYDYNMMFRVPCFMSADIKLMVAGWHLSSIYQLGSTPAHYWTACNEGAPQMLGGTIMGPRGYIGTWYPPYKNLPGRREFVLSDGTAVDPDLAPGSVLRAVPMGMSISSVCGTRGPLMAYMAGGHYDYGGTGDPTRYLGSSGTNIQENKVVSTLDMGLSDTDSDFPGTPMRWPVALAPARATSEKVPRAGIVFELYGIELQQAMSSYSPPVFSNTHFHLCIYFRVLCEDYYVGYPAYLNVYAMAMAHYAVPTRTDLA